MSPFVLSHFFCCWPLAFFFKASNKKSLYHDLYCSVQCGVSATPSPSLISWRVSLDMSHFHYPCDLNKLAPQYWNWRPLTRRQTWVFCTAGQNNSISPFIEVSIVSSSCLSVCGMGYEPNFQKKYDIVLYGPQSNKSGYSLQWVTLEYQKSIANFLANWVG